MTPEQKSPLSSVIPTTDEIYRLEALRISEEPDRYDRVIKALNGIAALSYEVMQGVFSPEKSPMKDVSISAPEAKTEEIPQREKARLLGAIRLYVVTRTTMMANADDEISQQYYHELVAYIKGPLRAVREADPNTLPDQDELESQNWYALEIRRDIAQVYAKRFEKTKDETILPRALAAYKEAISTGEQLLSERSNLSADQREGLQADIALVEYNRLRLIRNNRSSFSSPEYADDFSWAESPEANRLWERIVRVNRKEETMIAQVRSQCGNNSMSDNN